MEQQTQRVIVVGSKSKLKRTAVEAACARYKNTSIIIKSVDVKPGVSVQPFGLREIRTGARTRALEALLSDQTAEFGVGIESGLIEEEEERDQWYCITHVMIRHHDGRVSTCESGKFPIPSWVVEWLQGQIKNGNEIDLGRYTRRFAGNGVKDPHAYFSGNAMTRREVIELAVCAALSEFLTPMCRIPPLKCGDM